MKVRILFIFMIAVVLSACASSRPQTKSELIERAKAGDVDSQFILAQGYLFGRGRFIKKEDHKKSLYWMNKAVSQNHAKAKNQLGLMYKYGFGVKKNTVIAKKWYMEAAKSGDALAFNNLGKLFWEEQNLNESRKWYSRALEDNSHKYINFRPNVFWGMSQVEYDSGNKEEAYAWYVMALFGGAVLASNAGDDKYIYKFKKLRKKLTSAQYQRSINLALERYYDLYVQYVVVNCFRTHR